MSDSDDNAAVHGSIVPNVQFPPARITNQRNVQFQQLDVVSLHICHPKGKNFVCQKQFGRDVTVTRITGRFTEKEFNYKKQQAQCVMELSKEHPNFLKNLYLVRRSELIVAMISERSFSTLDTIFSPSRPDERPLRRVSIRCSRQFLAAIYFLHERNIVHGQLQPYYVYFSDKDLSTSRVKLFLPPKEFFKIDRKSEFTACELRHDARSTPTKASDMFSVGHILFRLFHGRDKHEVQMRRDMSQTLIRLIAHCQSLDPSERPTIEDSVGILFNEI